MISVEEDAVVYEVPLALVARAKLVLTDKLIAASRPIDMTGAEAVVETTLSDEQED